MGEIGDFEVLPVLRPLLVWYVKEVYPELHLAARTAVEKIEAANKEILDKPIPATEPQLSIESLPIPADKPSQSTHDN